MRVAILRKRQPIGLAALFGVLLIAGCSDSSSKKTSDEDAGTAGSGGGSSSRGASNGGTAVGGAANGGRSGGGKSNGGAAGTSTLTGGGGASTTDAGKDGEADAAGDGSPGAGGVGGGGAGGVSSIGLPNFEGPAPDQIPLVADTSHIATNIGGAVTHAVFDSKSNLLVSLGTGVDFNALIKLEPTFKKVVWMLSTNCGASAPAGCMAPSDFTDFRRGLAIGADDSVLMGGDSSQAGFAVSKYDSTGAFVWTKTWTNASGGGTDNSVAVGPKASVYGWGSGSGQAPGSPPADSGGPVLVRYEADGTRTFLTQIPPMPTSSSAGDVLVDGNGTAYTGFLHLSNGGTGPQVLTMFRFSTTGDAMQTTSPTVVVTQAAHMRLASDQKSIYLAGVANVASNTETIDIYNLNLDGSAKWHRQMHVHTETIDPVEGVTWSGAVRNVGDLQVTSDSIYLIGSYRNTYMNGSNPRPTTNPGFVARLNLDGTQVWFQEYQFEISTAVVVDSIDANYGFTLAIGSDDKPIAFFATQSGKPPDLLRLNKADGTILPAN